MACKEDSEYDSDVTTDDSDDEYTDEDADKLRIASMAALSAAVVSNAMNKMNLKGTAAELAIGGTIGLILTGFLLKHEKKLVLPPATNMG
jgi:hypothetical protein